ncbi:dihydrofolate synthase [alpha proteobacterium U9-1i]|nr:dihydrofolate synthase [alpha proteobacterium U9-1i]
MKSWAMRPWRVPYPKFGAGPGLERVAAIAGSLGIDLTRFGEGGAVIVGSNGKGSTAAMIAAILRETGANVGLFTSPHLFDLNERFNIDGADISDDELAHHWARVEAAAAPFRDVLGGFEFLFLIAADWFAARGCKHTVWEAGIGGRLDPVRLIEARRVALTSLDLEHTALLGDTLEAIAREKIDAAPAEATLFVGASCGPQWAAIESHCAERRVRGVLLDRARLTARGSGLALVGAHQEENAALAVALAENLADVSDAHIADGLAKVRWPGRLEVLQTDPLVVIDVGHTPDGVRRARAGFETLRGDRPGVLVCGVSGDKSVREIAGAIAPGFAVVICAAARHKGAPAAEVAAAVGAANPDAELILAESVAEAYRLALAKARANGAAVYAAGGLFLAAEFRAVHLGRDPAALAFF